MAGPNTISASEKVRYLFNKVTRDSEGLITAMTVKWPDDSSGNFLATDYNATHECYDGYNITHANSLTTITQDAVTRDSEGAVIVKPELLIS